MNIKESIKALLQSKFGGVQLSQARVDQIAKRLEGKVTTDEELETKLVALDELTPFAEMRAEDDRARSLQAELERERAKSKSKDDDDKSKTDDKSKDDNNTPQPDNAVLEAIKALTETVTALKGEKVVTDRKSQILAKLKDADEAYSAKVLRDFGRMAFNDDNAFNEYLTEVETDFTTHVQTAAESQLGKDVPFKSLTDAKGQVSEQLVEDIVNNL